MCGFAGVVAWDEKYRVSRDTLEKMSARIAHRGPDGQGLYLNHEEQITPDRPQVGLVHRRLAILDPDPRANQPFTDNQGRWIVFNGEIYNFRELRKELEKLKSEYVWRTNCDTEALLVAYDVWGEKCVEHLNGMFAFVVWDSPRNGSFAAIDRMGQKPLYWAALTVTGAPWTGNWPSPSKDESKGVRPVLPLDDASAIVPALGIFAFASELAALRELRWLTTDIDWKSLGDCLRWGYVPAPWTIYQTARKFGPSTRGFLCADRVVTGSYFDRNQRSGGEATPIQNNHCVERTRSMVMDAVRRQLVADVPLGCFLSGGVDSSVIAAAMKAGSRSEQRVMTFSIGFDDKRFDETAFAGEVAKHLGTDHRQFTVRPNAAADLPALAAVFGEPFADSSALPTHYVARETRQHVKVALSGDGGDELFGGYDRYRAVQAAAIFDHVPDFVRRAAASTVWQRVPGSHPKSWVARLKRFLRTAEFPDALRRYLDIMMMFPAREMRNLLGARYEVPHQDASLLSYGTKLLTRFDPVQAALALDRVSYLPGDLLTKVDRASMLHALEVRSPFMDHELVQFAAGLTTDQLLKGGPKRMLREAFAQDLPAWVFKRKKMGFAVPIGEWFRGELRAMLRDNLFASDSFASQHFNLKVVQRLVDEHEQQRVDHSQRLYALLMLELWWRTARS
jgi:asparagine synthase (glutamine-hydrolysing)